MSEIAVRMLVAGELAVGGAELLPQTGSADAVWVDVLEPDEQSLEALAREFPLHPLAVEDCLHFPQRPKLESYGSSVFMIWLVPESAELLDDGLDVLELDVFLGSKWLITLHREPLAAAARVADEAAAYLGRGCDWTLHALLDLTVDMIFPVLDEISDRLEDLEDAMLQRADQGDLQRLLRTKRLLVTLHKVVGPERDLLRELVREESLVSADAYRYFQDVGDHLARVEDGVETYREVASGAMDVYLSAVSNRLNAIMKQLTVVATIFMPLTLISGIYGMNVVLGMWPPVNRVWSFWAVMGGMVAIAAGMGLYFRRKHWW